LVESESKSNLLSVFGSVLKNVDNGVWLFFLGDFLLSDLLAKNPEVLESELDELTNTELLKDFLNFDNIEAWDSLLLDEVNEIDKSDKTYLFSVNFIEDCVQK